MTSYDMFLFFQTNQEAIFHTVLIRMVLWYQQQVVYLESPWTIVIFTIIVKGNITNYKKWEIASHYSYRYSYENYFKSELILLNKF